MSDIAEKAKVPAIRFKGFTDAWEQRKLGDVTKSYSGGTPSVGKKEYYNGQIPFIRSAEINSDTTELFLSETGMNNSSAKMVYSGDILYALYGATSGEVGIAQIQGAINQAILAIKPDNGYDSQFLMQWLRGQKQKIIDKYLQGGQGNLSGSLVKDLLVKFPNNEEQQQIGEFLKHLDNLITLHQRKLLKIKNVKKAMLEKMFPKNGNSVPEIRFAGFTDAWEQRKFSETFIYLQNNALSRADLNYEQGLIKNVHYGDVLIKFGEILDVDSAELPFISNNEFTVSSTSLLQNGDVIIADAAEDETVGKCSEIKGIEGINVVSGLHTIPCRPNKTFASGYLGYYLNSSAYHDQLLPLIQGTKISSISKSALLNTDIIYPDSEQEQLQIGQFFQSLDNLITLHQRKPFCKEGDQNYAKRSEKLRVVL